MNGRGKTIYLSLLKEKVEKKRGKEGKSKINERKKGRKKGKVEKGTEKK